MKDYDKGRNMTSIYVAYKERENGGMREERKMEIGNLKLREMRTSQPPPPPPLPFILG